MPTRKGSSVIRCATKRREELLFCSSPVSASFEPTATTSDRQDSGIAVAEGPAVIPRRRGAGSF